jgi:hypothetical protein
MATNAGYVRTLFGLVGSDLTPAVVSQLKDAGFNTITQGFFSNPYINRAPDFQAWKVGFDPWFDALLRPLRDNGFSWLATGDDLARVPALLTGSTTGYGPQAVQYAVSRLAASGLCVGIEMVDEASAMWRNGPDPAMYGLVSNMRSVPGCPPLAWPVDNGAHVTAAQLAPWFDPSLCDYYSVYSPAQVLYMPDLPGQCFSRKLGVRAMNAGLDLLPDDLKRRFVLVPFTGAYGVGPSVYVGPWSAEVVVDSALQAVARGVTGLRYYSWDIQAWAAGRVNTGPTQTWSTGTTPTVGPDRWQAAAAVNQMLARLEAPL